MGRKSFRLFFEYFKKNESIILHARGEKVKFIYYLKHY